MDIWTICFRTVIFYAFIIFIYRLMGKREVGQLGIVDLIVSILIAELAAMSIENFDDSILNSLLPIIILTIFQIVLAYITLRKPEMRNFLDGKPSVIINNGMVNFKEMTSQKYNLDDLLLQIREKGYRSIEDIEYAILENNGKLSVFPKKVLKSPLPLPLILDGEVQKDTLIYLNKNQEWLNLMLEKKELNIDEIFYAFFRDKSIYFIKKDELK